MKRFHVTDHALIRYMERILKLDMAAVRNEIGTKVAAAALAGASTVTVDGVVYQIGIHENRSSVVTLWPHDSPPPRQAPPPSRQPSLESKRNSRWRNIRGKKWRK